MAEACRPPRILDLRLKPSKLKQTVQVSTPCHAANFAYSLIGQKAHEHLMALYLNQRNCAIAYDIFTSGSMGEVHLDVTGILRGAMLVGATAVLTAHQHPSGLPTPSDADRALWIALTKAASSLGLRHLDDFVLGDDHYYARSTERTYPYGECP